MTTTELTKGAKVNVLFDNRSLPQEVEILNTPTTDTTMEEYCSETKGWQLPKQRSPKSTKKSKEKETLLF